MKRLGYRKSRTGCKRCKERRVKCDEKRPCSACVRHKIPCSLDEGSDEIAGRSEAAPAALNANLKLTKSPSSTSQQLSGSPATSLKPRDIPIPTINDAVHSFVVPPSSGIFLGATRPTLASFLSSQSYLVSQAQLQSNMDSNKVDWLSDLELMHHYSTATYKSFPASVGAQTLFRDDIPRLAVSHPYVMHQVLALSAQHLRVLKPDCSVTYGMRAAQHQANAIQGLREALPPDTNEIKIEDAYALFVASSFLMCSSFASLHTEDSNGSEPCASPYDKVLEIFSLIRGVGLVLRLSQIKLRNGPLLNAFQYESHGEDNSAGDIRQLLLPRLAGRLADLRSRLKQMADLDAGVQEAADGAIVLLIGCVTPPWPEPRVIRSIELRTVFLWPLILGDAFVALMRSRHLVVMPILAHYCVMLRATEPACWFVRGWSSDVSEFILKSVKGTQWETLCAWQTEQIKELGT